MTTKYQSNDATPNYTWEADGNLTSDGGWSYEWDAEPSRETEARWTAVGCPAGVRARAERPNQNRLIAMETAVVAAAVGVPRVRLEFGYDADGRRISKRVWLGVVNPENGGAVNWQLRLNRRFGYDGWNMVAEFHANVADPAFTAMTRVAGYAWGLDHIWLTAFPRLH